MAIPFILSSKVTIACYGFCLLRHTNKPPARDIITVARCFRVYFITTSCTLLHRELRDYSLGQIASITQLLCHVSALLTSACKQA